MSKPQTKTIVRIALALGTAVSLYFVPWPIVRLWLKPLPNTVQEQVDAATQEGFDGIIVYVDQKGKAPAYYAAGWHNRDKKIPADPHALFKIASIGKLYVAVSITKLAASQKLSLDKTVADYFPELKKRIEYASEITIKQLVQHRSGIPNFTEMPEFWSSLPENSEQTLALVLDKSANFKPDTDYKYSNTNYLLLSMLIEQVTGADKFEYIKQEILKPLHLKNTYGSIDQIDMDRLMSGYYVGYLEDTKTTNYGSMVATAEDVGIFLRALNDGSLFKEGEREIYNQLYEYEHTGLIVGYQSIAEYDKDIDAVVIQFTSTTNFDGYEWNLSEIIHSRIVKLLEE
jgi:CubicO group peptidase (beta-lactamase class C family)